MPNFIFCIHNHQPVGNFDHVIEDSYQNAYLPFIKAIGKHPSIKLCFHIAGYLLDWLIENHDEYIEMLHEMVKRGQVEMLGGGYYEPILAVIPPHDRVGQLKMMSDKLEDVFGKRPRGMWLAERIWEPQLPCSLKEAGMEYVVVDDYHFVKAGLRKEQLTGYYITEDLGKTLKVFPGSERLRYIIPFETVDKFMENMKWVDTLGQHSAAVFADDGEKFGTWPGTHQWVYKEGWLEKFLETIAENTELIKPVTFSEHMNNNKLLGRVYLPTTSYMEMGKWALPAEASETYANLVNEVKSWHDGERIRRFLQGGFWRNFFAKYPEANWMHKRMLMVSEEIGNQDARCKMQDADSNFQPATCNLQPATSHLYTAQCNDAYWHGVFGGLYLPHLRRSVYENLIKAENLVEERGKGQGARGKEETVYEKDFDADTFNEILVRTPSLNLFLSPHNGGSIVEMDFRPKVVNLSNTLSRWEEGYHHKVRTQSEKTGSGEAKSIHDLSMSKQEGLDKYLFFDKFQRVSLVEHFFKKEETLDSFKKNVYEEIGDFFNKPYEERVKGQGSRVKKGEEGVEIVLSREGKVKGQSVLVEKKITVKDNEIDVKYRVANLGTQSPHPPFEKGGAGGDLRFGIEFNLILPCCDGPDGFYDVQPTDVTFKKSNPPIPPLEKGGKGGFEKGGMGGDLGLESTGEIAAIRQIGLVDKWTKMKVDFSFDKDTSVWRFPIETVSLSEAGFERIFQGSCLLFFWDISMDKSFEAGFKVKVEAI